MSSLYTFKKSHHFDQRLNPTLQAFKKMMKAMSEQSVLKARLQAINSKESIEWNYDQSFISDEAIIKFLDNKYDGDISKALRWELDKELVSQITQLVTIASIKMPASYINTIVHLPRMESVDSVIDLPLTSLKSLPNWNVTINFSGHGLYCREYEIAGITFAITPKSFLTNNFMPDNGVYSNCLSMVIYFTNGVVVTAHTPPLDTMISWRDAFIRINTVNDIGIALRSGLYKRQVKDDLEMDPAALDAMCRAITCLFYLLINKDKLKDQNGNSAGFRQNPTLELVDNNVLVNTYDKTLLLYLD